MFERFTDQARHVVVLAKEEARLLSHNWIGTEHILLGIIRQGDNVAARALESLGISLEAVRQEVEAIIGQVPRVPSEEIPFTPRSKRVLELALRESLQLQANYIGPEHILLGLIREGDGVAPQVLIKLGADPNRVRQRVIQLVSGQQRRLARRLPHEGAPATEVQARLELIAARLAAVEQRVATGPDTGDLDEQLTGEIERLHALLRQHGIDPQDKPA